MKTWELFKPAKITFKHLKEDLPAGLITGIVALPLCLALSIASGVDPVYGIYTSIIAGVLVSIFGGSELGIAGPAAAMTVLLYSVVLKFGFEGLLVAGFLAGIIQIVMGLTGIGRVVKFIPYTVITGFTTGIGILIIIGQLGNITGIPLTGDGIITKLISFFTNLQQINFVTLAVGLGTLLVIFLIPKISKKIPASFVALVLATVLAVYLNLNLTSVGTVPSQLPGFHGINFDLVLIKNVLPSAIAIALLASIESLLSAVALDGMTGTKHSSSKELVGQGIANTILPFFRGIPATGVIVRSATNVKNGGKTRLSGIIHSIVLLLILLLLAPLAKQIPLTVLAGILIYTAMHLISFEDVKVFLKESKSDLLVLLITIGSTVFLDLTTAILIGFSLAGLVFIKKMSEDASVTLVPHSAPATQSTTLAADISGIARTYRISGPLFFASAFELEKISSETPEKNTPALVLDLVQVNYMDSTAMAMLSGIVEEHKKRGEIYIAIKSTSIKKKILNSSVMKYITTENFVSSAEEGLEKAKQKYGTASA